MEPPPPINKFRKPIFAAASKRRNKRRGGGGTPPLIYTHALKSRRLLRFEIFIMRNLISYSFSSFVFTEKRVLFAKTVRIVFFFFSALSKQA